MKIWENYFQLKFDLQIFNIGTEIYSFFKI